jgi:hypothetical protein
MSAGGAILGLTEFASAAMSKVLGLWPVESLAGPHPSPDNTGTPQDLPDPTDLFLGEPWGGFNQFVNSLL